MNRPFHDFFTFFSCKIAKFESDLLKTNEHITCITKSRNFTDICVMAPTIQTSVKFWNFARWITFKFGSCANFQALFLRVSTDFLSLVQIKSWKNCRTVYWRRFKFPSPLSHECVLRGCTLSMWIINKILHVSERKSLIEINK